MLIISTIILILLTILLGGVFNMRLHQEKLQASVVKILPENKSFIKADEVAKSLHITDSATIDIKYFEEKLSKNKFINKAEVYRDLNGNLIAEVTQYKPIARVLGTNSYYLDENGHKRPLSHHYTENVVLIYGDISQKQQKNVVDLVKQIHQDELLNDIVSEIHIKPYGYNFRIKGIKAKFVLNNDAYEAQLHKLKVMYVYLKKHRLVNKYQQIDLRYNKQVVCK